jgi:hypothetical protein
LNDLDARAPAHRMSHLSRYMTERASSAKILLVAEAPGYQGAKFSGCAMSSERKLLEANLALDFDQVFFKGEKHRTSKAVLSNGKKNLLGSIEPTATIVWDRMLELCGSHEFVLWNAFALHPHPQGDMLDNRTPTDGEIEQGLGTLQAFLAAFSALQVVAVGRKSEGALGGLGVPYKAVRHPANGGAGKFRDGVSGILQGRRT